MNELQIFNYEGKPLRTVEKDDEIWWVLKDVCDALSIVDSKTVPRRLDSDEVCQIPLIDSMGRTQMQYVVNEPGLYSVILRSDKPEAKNFKRWVTHEVLPAIRQKGAYSMQSPMSPAQLIAAQAQVLVDMERRMNEVEDQTLALEAKVNTAIRAFSRPAEDHWRADMDKAVRELCAEINWSLPRLQGRLYAELERAANCQINARLINLRKRKKRAGARHKDLMALTKLDAIAADKQLRAIFEGIVRSWQAGTVQAGEEGPHEED